MSPPPAKSLLLELSPGLLAVLLAACGPSAADPLPPEDDLYAYALAVAEKTRLKVPADRYLPVYHIGRVHQRFGMEEKALEYFRKATEIEPRAPEPYRETGFILSQRRDRMTEAVEAYQQSLVADPAQEGAYTRIGMIYNHQGRFEDAVRGLEQEVRQGGASDLTYYQLGQAYQFQGKYEKALERYAKVPEMREALYGTYQSLQALGRKEEAAAALEKFRSLKDVMTEAEKEADRTQKKSNREEQLRFAGATWADAARVFLEEHRREKDPAKRGEYLREVLHAMKEALRFDRHLRDVYTFLADHYYAEKRPAESLAVLERAAEAFPDDPLLHFQVASLSLSMASEACRERQESPRIEAGFQHLSRAVELAPEFSEAHLELAKAILFCKPRRELIPRALEHARKALDLSKAPAALNYDILAMAQHYAGDRQGALETLRRGSELFPEEESLKERLRRYQELAP